MHSSSRLQVTLRFKWEKFKKKAMSWKFKSLILETVFPKISNRTFCIHRILLRIVICSVDSISSQVKIIYFKDISLACVYYCKCRLWNWLEHLPMSCWETWTAFETVHSICGKRRHKDLILDLSKLTTQAHGILLRSKQHSQKKKITQHETKVTVSPTTSSSDVHATSLEFLAHFRS